MNKKGFTLVEVIVCISLLVIIGVGSFVGIRMVNKKINIDNLNQITDKAVQAAQVYIETNKEATNQLYSNKNGVSLPLQLLVSEGLLNLDGTKLEEDDLKNQYVVTFLGGTGSSENCEQITSTTSWSNNKPIYLCMNSTTGSSNLATIDPTKYGNKTYVSNEPYYFKGTYPNNYAYFNGNRMRIISVDVDDTLTVAGYIGSYQFAGTNETKTTIFNENEVFDFPTIWSGRGCSKCYVDRYAYSSKCQKDLKYQTASERATDVYGGFHIEPYMYYNTEICENNQTNLYPSVSQTGNTVYGYTWLNSNYRYLHLKSCMKIASGAGSFDNPYIIKDNNC